MAHAASFFDGKLDHLLRSRSEINLTAPLLSKAAHPFDHFTHAVWFKTKLAQHTPGYATFLFDQAEEQVFCADNILAHPFCFLVSQA